MQAPMEWLLKMIAEQEVALKAALAAGDTEAAKTAEREIANYRGMLGSK